MKGHWWKSALVVSFSTIVALALAEGILRIGGIRFSDSFYELDFTRGWRLRPGHQGLQQTEGEALIHINDHGMRDRTRAFTKSPGHYRIAFLGDSFTEAMQVPLEQTFTGLLEGRECGAKGKIEALNFGVSGYGTAQELLLYRDPVTRFQPDAVALVFFAGNDLYNNVRLLNPSNADAAPYFQLEANGSLTPVEAFASGGKPGPASLALRNFYTTLHENFRIVQVVTEAYYKSGRSQARAAEQSRIAEKYGRDYMEWLAYVAPREEAMRESWMVTERLLAKFAAEVKANGRRFVLVLANNAVQVLPDPAQRRDFESRYSLDSIDYADLRLKAWAERNGVEIVWLAEALRAAAEQKQEMLHGFGLSKGSGHWNAAGHRVVADRLAQTLCGN